MMPRALFHEFLDQEGIKTPETLRTMMVRKGPRPRLLIATPTQQELAIADAIVNCRRVGPLRRLFIEAKVAEFFCLVIDRLQADSYSPQSAARVTERDRRQLARVRELLEECYTSPPTILELARQFGLNRNKLCGGFTQLYGKSIFDFCQQLRMEKARPTPGGVDDERTRGGRCPPAIPLLARSAPHFTAASGMHPPRSAGAVYPTETCGRLSCAPAFGRAGSCGDEIVTAATPFVTNR